MGRLAVGAALLAVVGCGGDGGVSLRLDLPSDDALGPFDSRVDGLTLTVSADGTTVYTATREFNGLGEAVDFGRLPAGDGLAFELMGRTDAARVIAYGRSDAPVDVSRDDSHSVDVRVRRPYVYVAGGQDVLAIDTTLEPGLDYEERVSLGAVTGAVAATPDGAYVVTVAGTDLRMISTASHGLVAQMAVLSAPAVHLAVSPNGRWAVVSHTVSNDDMIPRGVSIVDLADLADGGDGAVRFVATGQLGEVVVGNDTAWVLQDPLAGLTCKGVSSVVPIELASGTAGIAIDLGGPGADIAASGDVVYAAMPCDDEVREIRDGVVSETSPLRVAGVSALTVARGRLWAMGHIDGEFAHLILASARLDGSDIKMLEMPTLEERAVATELVGPGQDGLIRMTADLASASDMAVLPDGEHVAILVAAIYVADPIGDAGGGQPIQPRVSMVTFEYQLVQLSTGLSAQRLRTACGISWDPGALLDVFACAQAPGQEHTAVNFVPTRLTALFGSR